MVGAPPAWSISISVVLACHSDQALALLSDADEREQSILGAMTYQSNDTVLHTDAACCR